MIKAHNLINAPAAATLASGIAIDSTSLTVSSAIAISAPFKATFVSTGEIIEAGAVSGTTWSNITRGAEGTTPSAYNANEHLELRLTAGHLTERRPFNVYPAATAAENTANIRAAIASGYVSLAPATYPVIRTGTETELFLVTTPMIINGNGASIVADASTPTTVDIFKFTTNQGFSGLSIKDIKISSTLTSGRHGINFVCGADALGGYFSNVRMSNVIIGSMGDYGLRVTNPTSPDGFFCSQIRDCQFTGAHLERIGDSVVIDGCQSSPSVAGRIGFNISLVGQGSGDAGCVTFSNCNSIASGGAFKAQLYDTSSIRLINCNFEYTSSTVVSPIGGCAYINGGSDLKIEDCRFLVFTPTMGDGLILESCTKPTVINSQLSGQNAINVKSTCANTYAPQASNNPIFGTWTNAGTTRAAI